MEELLIFGDYYASRSATDDYFADRRSTPYRSTLALSAWLGDRGFFNTLPMGALVADIACGTGSETAHLAACFPELNFIGVDLELSFVDAARARHSDLPNLSFVQGDIYQLDDVAIWPEVRAVWLSQTLSWLPWWRTELQAIVGPDVDRIGLSTLAWDGPGESEVVHYLPRRDDPRSERVFYNVNSIPLMIDLMSSIGFGHQDVEKFEIDIDLQPPKQKGLGSYTLKTQQGERLTFSMWQMLPWHFFLFSRQGLVTP